MKRSVSAILAFSALASACQAEPQKQNAVDPYAKLPCHMKIDFAELERKDSMEGAMRSVRSFLDHDKTIEIEKIEKENIYIAGNGPYCALFARSLLYTNDRYLFGIQFSRISELR